MKTGKPESRTGSKRHKLYDSMLLNLMAKNRYESRDIFANLFKNHPIDRIFRFLDEQSTLWEELRIISQMPPTPFLLALKDIVMRKK